MFKKFACMLVLIFPGYTFADSLLCDGTTVTVVDAPSSKDPFFTISIKNNAIEKIYNLEIQKDFLYVRCEKTTNGESVILINHFCGGSGCADFGNFGIIEASSGQMILEPNQPFTGNLKSAKEIMRKEIKPFTCKKENNEICIHSAIELG